MGFWWFRVPRANAPVNKAEAHGLPWPSFKSHIAALHCPPSVEAVPSPRGFKVRRHRLNLSIWKESKNLQPLLLKPPEVGKLMFGCQKELDSNPDTTFYRAALSKLFNINDPQLPHQIRNVCEAYNPPWVFSEVTIISIFIILWKMMIRTSLLEYLVALWTYHRVSDWSNRHFIY